MLTLNTKKEDVRFALFGSGKVLCEFILILKKYNFHDPVVITHLQEHHTRDDTLLNSKDYYENIFEFCNNNNVSLIESNDINNIEFISTLKNQGINYIISYNNRFIFKDNYFSSFKNIFNMHHGRLPFEKAGSPTSNKILNNVNEIYVTMHQVDKGIDSGPIIDMEAIKVKDILDYTIEDIFRMHNDLSIKLFNSFINNIIDQKEIYLDEQDKSKSITLPRLYTEIHGAIDWNCTWLEIKRFVKAFSHPYPGAFTFYKDKEIKIFDIDLEEPPHYFHPFFIGKIIGEKNEKYAKVVVSDKILILKEIIFNDKLTTNTSILRSGETLFTPPDILLKAKNTRVYPNNIKL